MSLLCHENLTILLVDEICTIKLANYYPSSVISFSLPYKTSWTINKKELCKKPENVRNLIKANVRVCDGYKIHFMSWLKLWWLIVCECRMVRRTSSWKRNWERKISQLKKSERYVSLTDFHSRLKTWLFSKSFPPYTSISCSCLPHISCNLTTRCLAVTGGDNIGECSR